MKAKLVMFFPNGAVVVLDQNGQQMPAWQTNLVSDHLHRMFEAGVVTPETPIQHLGGEETVDDWIVRKHPGGYPTSGEKGTRQ